MVQSIFDEESTAIPVEAVVDSSKSGRYFFPVSFQFSINTMETNRQVGIFRVTTILGVLSLVTVFSVKFSLLQLKKVPFSFDSTALLVTTNGTSSSNAIVGDEETLLLAKNDSTIIFPTNPRIYFIHVGKTGGVTLQTIFRTIPKSDTISCRMNKSLNGNDDSTCYHPQANESQLSRHILTHFHMQTGAPKRTEEESKWLLNNTNVFLISVRDPIDRLISMYNYHRNMNYQILAQKRRIRPNSVWFFNCFSEEEGLDEVVNTLKNVSKVSEQCKKIGLEVLLGRNFKGGAHFKLGYQFYKRYTMDSHPATHAVAVIRMEHMFDDMSQLDRALGGTGDFPEARSGGWKYTHGSEKYHFPYISELSPSNTHLLCCLIYMEMEAYQAMILKAINLDHVQKRETLSTLLHHCHIQLGEEDDDDIGSFSWELFRHGPSCNSSLSFLNATEAA